MVKLRRNAANKKTLIKSLQYRGMNKVISVKTINKATKNSAGVYLVNYKKRRK